MKILVRIFVVLTLLIAGLAVIQAQDTIRVGETVEGELTNGEEVLYHFEAKAGERFIITLRSSDFDTYLFVRDSSGADLMTDDDSGGNTDSQLLGLEAPGDGVYTIVVDSFSDSASGAFTLTLQGFNPTDAVVGEPTIGTFDSSTHHLYFALEGRMGQIVDIVVDSGNMLDTTIELISPFGYVMNSNEDAPGTVDPALTNILLDSDGTYYVHIQPQKANATLNGDLRLTVENTPLPSLDDGPIELEFENGRYQHFAMFNGVAGETVRLSLDSNAATRWSSYYVRLRQADTEFAYFSFNGSTQVSAELVVPDNGEVVLIIELYEDATVSLSLGRSLE